MLLYCNSVPYCYIAVLYPTPLKIVCNCIWCGHVIMYYSCVMNLIIPQWLRNRQWMKKVVNIELIYPLNTWSSCAYQCIVRFQNPLKQTSTFLVKFSIKVKSIFCFIHCMCVCLWEHSCLDAWHRLMVISLESSGI
jgi:hypothetical protein